MGKSTSSKTPVTDYRLTIHFGLARQPVDYFRAVRINEKDVWRGQVSGIGPATVDVKDDYLFGGPTKEGGVDGRLHFLPGQPNQLLSNNLAARQGKTPETAVAYRGVSSVYFTGKSLGEGFKWGTNVPTVARQVEIEATRSGKGLNPAYALIPNPDHPDKPDANPIHIIYEAAVDPEDGIATPGDMDIPAYEAAAKAIYDEKVGMSLLWAQAMACEDFINEVQSHINAVTYSDPETGLTKTVLIRDDYVVEELFEINADNAELTSFSRRLVGETVNAITVGYTDPNTEDKVTLTVNNLASAQVQASNIPDTRDYYGFRHAAVAEDAGWRELRAANAPLASATVRGNRECWKLRPGQPVRVYFPDADDPSRTVDFIARVGEIDYGDDSAEDIPIDLTEDVFSLTRPLPRRGPAVEWVDPSADPTPMTAQLAFTLPLFFSTDPSYSRRALDLVYPEVQAVVLGHHTEPDTIDFSLLAETTSDSFTLTERGVLSQSLPVAAVSDVLWSFTNPRRGPQIGGFAILGSSETSQEIVQITGYDGFQWTIRRGVLDTTPHAWPSGAPVWFFNPGSRTIDDQARAAGETVTYKLLPRTSKGTLDPDLAPPLSATLSDRPYRPLRPANVKLNGVPPGGTINVSAAGQIALSWATRNRLLEEGQAVAWDASPVAPEYRQRTVVVITDTAGVEIIRYTHLWTENALLIPNVWLARWAAVKVYVFAERDGFMSLQGAAFEVTGLANDATAAPPPPAPEPGVPPPPILAPAEGVFVASGGFLRTEASPSDTAEDDNPTDDTTPLSRTPALKVDGFAEARRADYPEARGLVIQYRPRRVGTGATASYREWIPYPTVELNDYDTHVPITDVAALTRYQVRVAYVSPEGVTGGFRLLGEFETGELVANSAQTLGGMTAAQIRQALQAVADLGEALGDDAAEKILEIIRQIDEYGDDGENLGRAILRQARELTDLRRILDSLTYLDGIPVGTAIVRETTARQEADTLIVHDVEQMSVRVDDTQAALLNESELRASADEAEAYQRGLLGVRVGATEGAILTEAQLRADADSAEASAREALALRTTGVELAIVTEREARIDADELEATSREVLSGRVDANETAIINERQVRADADSAEAQQRTLLASRVGDAESSIAAEALTRSNADGVFAQNFTLLGVRRGDSSGYILNSASVDISGYGTVGSVLQALTLADGNNAAAITSEQSARIAADGVIAQSVTNLSTTVGGNTSSITQLFQVTDGLRARYSLVLNVNGLITGIEANGATGSFVIAAQNFGVAAVGGNGQVYYPFLIDAANDTLVLTGKVRVQGDLIVSGSVTNEQLANNTVLDTYVGHNGDTVVLTNNVPKRVHGKYIDVKKAASPVKIDFSCWGTFTHDAGGSFIAYVQLVRSRGEDGGTVLQTIPIYGSGMANDTWQGPIPVKWVDKPGETGVWHYYVQVYFNVSNMTIQSITARYIELMELKNNPGANIDNGTGSGSGVGSGGGSGGGGGGSGGGGGIIDPGGGGGGVIEQQEQA